MNDQLTETILSPEEIEKQLIEKQQAKLDTASQRSPEDVAAAMFSMYSPVLRNILGNKKKFTRKSMIKVFMAAVEAPLNGKEVKLLTKQEKEVYSIVSALLEAKWQLMLSTLMKHQEDLAEAKAKDVVNNTQIETASTPEETTVTTLPTEELNG